jgi:hypothetical protein
MTETTPSRAEQLLVLRMGLAALREDETAFGATWLDLGRRRDTELAVTGRSGVFYRTLRILAASAAGASLDSAEAHGKDFASVEQWFEDRIRTLLDEATA